MNASAIFALAVALPCVHAGDALKDLLIVPPVVSPGEIIEVQVLDPARTPPAGKWNIAGVEAAGESPLRIRLPDSLRVRGPVPVSYTSAAGVAVFQTAGADGVW